MNKRGFTLIELLIVIILLGVLSALIVGNFFTSLKKGRDAARKTDLSNVQRALESYYADNNKYPISISFGNPLNDPGGSGKSYMEKLPDDPVTGHHYEYVSPSGTGADYKIFACLEDSQQMLPVTATGYASATMTSCGSCFTAAGAVMTHCVFSVNSSNISP